MPIEDIKKLESILSSSERLSLLSPIKTKKHYTNCYKLIDNRTISYGISFPVYFRSGVNIDIFAIVKVPKASKDIFLKESEALKQQFYNSFYDFKSSHDEIKAKQIKYVEYSTAYNSNEYDEIMMLGSRYAPKNVMDKEFFAQRVKLEFEKKMFYAPHQYDKYLSLTYGDYMTLPPKEKRVAVHLAKLYWKNPSDNIEYHKEGQ